MNKHQAAIKNLLALLNSRLYEKNFLNCSSMMGNHDYITYFIDWIFDVLIKKVFLFGRPMKIITGNE